MTSATRGYNCRGVTHGSSNWICGGAGVIALLPLLERPMAEVAADLEVGSLTQHSIDLERVAGKALDGSG